MTPENQPLTRADLDRAVETIAAEISTSRQELATRMDRVERNLELATAELRLTTGLLNGLNRWADKLDKDEAALGQNYFTQARAIEDLRRRVQALEARQT